MKCAGSAPGGPGVKFLAGAHGSRPRRPHTGLMRTFSLGVSLFLLLGGCSRVHLGTHDGGGGGGPDAGASEPCGPTLCEPGLVCCNASCGICAAPGEGCSTVACVDECTSNDDCAATEYCARPDDACAGPGTCAPRPTDCPPVVRESCGCDGVTYASPCDANASGAEVLHDGACESAPCAAQDIAAQGLCATPLGVRWDGARCEAFSGCSCVGADCDERFTSLEACMAAYASCAPSHCTSNAECGAGRYCHVELGSCGAAGECRAIPGELPCGPTSQPVCGCDGRDYACEDAANQQGVSAASLGSCAGECAPDDARGEGACFLSLGYRWNGTSCEFVGGCSCEGTDCPLPATAEECEAAHAGCGRPCGGFLGSTCAATEWCDYAGLHNCGRDDGMGVCRPRPSGCETVFEPACGCDGTVYDNACLSHAAGVDTWADPDSCGGPAP